MSKKQKKFDPKRNHIFAEAIDEMRRREKKRLSQKEIAERMGVNENTVSRILNLHNEVTEEAITQLQTASGCIFNLQWLRGESAVMLAEDVDKDKIGTEENLPQSTPVALPDYSSLMNATIAAQQTSIESLKRELADKEESSAKAEASAKREIAAKQETIDALRSELKGKDATIAAKDAHIETLKREIAGLRAALASQQTKDAIGNYPFTIGAADNGERLSAGK